MLSTTRLWVAALVAAAFAAGQGTKCETTCSPKVSAATKCSTTDCLCYAYDDPEVVSCLKTECGKGYSSVREIMVQTCRYFDVELNPDPPGTPASSSSTTLSTSPGAQSTAASNPLTSVGSGGTQTTTPGESTSSSGTSSGSGSNGGSSGTNSGSNSGSNVQPQKDGLSTGELIGIIIGSVSAVATIAGTWAAIRWRKKRGTEGAASSAALPSNTSYHPPQTSSNNVHNFHIAPTYHNNGQPYGYQPPPPYQTPYMYQK